MSEVILFYINKQELNWIRYAFTFGRSFSSHSTLSIAFKVSWPPTNLPIKSMLKGLTSSFSFVFFSGKLSNSVHKQNKTTVADQGERAGGPAFPLLLDHQTEARRAEKKFFLRPPPPLPHLIWRSGSATEQFTILVLKSSFMYKWAQQCVSKMLPAKHGMLFIQMTTRAKRDEATSKQITLWILQWMD